MPNIATVLKAEIARISRKEARAETERLQASVAQQRKDIVALRRQIAALEKAMSRLQRPSREDAQPVASTSAPESSGTGAKFSAAKLVKHRQLLGISANEYSALIGASGQSVYKWETGKAYPRAKQLERLATVLAIGKREFNAQLAAANV